MKRFVTYVTLICLFHAVRELMVLVIALLVESLTTVFARIWLITGVYPCVRVQRRASIERFAANRTRVRFFFCVYDLVSAERRRLPETFSTYLLDKMRTICIIEICMICIWCSKNIFFVNNCRSFIYKKPSFVSTKGYPLYTVH